MKVNEEAKSPEQKAIEYLETAHLYHLGRLPTEASHPQTKNLADLAQKDLRQAVRLLQMIDLQALSKFQFYLPALEPLAKAIRDTIRSGGRIFICGCGATGRLALSLEYLWRMQNPHDPDRVVAFMAGGDVALVHSLEGFEDFPAFGAEQLRDLGFQEGDLLISSTEGGETPFVIGATEEAILRSKQNAFFLYCNPRDQLRQLVERSRRVIDNPRIVDISLFVGPMALSGSTRMQASTILQLAIGLTLFHWSNANEAANLVASMQDHYRGLTMDQLCNFVEAEAETYLRGDKTIYSTDDWAITVFTDSTERAPTFSLPPFNNQVMPRPDHSLSYVMIPSANSTAESWQLLLRRAPRSLEWESRNPKTTARYLSGFDFSRSALNYRQTVLPEVQHEVFEISHTDRDVIWKFRELEARWPRAGKGLLLDHLMLKMLLNIHSTLVMGRLKRYVSNFMTFVYPTNGKLVDRASRYVRWLLEIEGRPSPKPEILVTELFRSLETLQEGESVVLKTFAKFKDRNGA